MFILGRSFLNGLLSLLFSFFADRDDEKVGTRFSTSELSRSKAILNPDLQGEKNPNFEPTPCCSGLQQSAKTYPRIKPLEPVNAEYETSNVQSEEQTNANCPPFPSHCFLPPNPAETTLRSTDEVAETGFVSGKRLRCSNFNARSAASRMLQERLKTTLKASTVKVQKLPKRSPLSKLKDKVMRSFWRS